jgi:hypothetical protein
MKKLNLKNITLFSFCWGESYFESTLKSILCSKKYINFGKSIIASNIDVNIYSQVLKDNDIEIFNIPINLNNNLEDDDNNRTNFSSLFLDTIYKVCETDYVLTVQQDSCIIFPEQWTDLFFEYDYIGAPWPMQIIQSGDMVAGKLKTIENIVGNGGFSLRSKKYIDISRTMPIFHKNEDLNLCVFNYRKMKNQDIKYAPPEIAIKFSVEHPIPNLNVFDRNFLMTYQSFGFHGSFNKAGMEYINQQ